MLLLSPLPPPAGGISTWTRLLLDRGLPGDYVLAIVNTSVGPGREVFQRGGWVQEAIRTLRIISNLLGQLLRFRPDLVHINTAAGFAGLVRDDLCALLARATGARVVAHYRALAVVSRKRWLHAAALGFLARLAHVNLTLNSPSRDYVAGRARRSRPVRTLPNFFDERELPRRAVPIRREHERARVVFVGALIEAKGCRDVARVSAHFPEVEFVLLGKHYPETDRLLAGAGPNLVVGGEVSHDEVLATLRASHLLLFPSQSEGFPNAVCEAMAVGLPVVGTPVGAIPEMVDDGSGGRIAAAGEGSLEAAVAWILEDEERRRALGRHNQEKAYSRYSYPAVSQELMAVWDAALPRGV